MNYSSLCTNSTQKKALGNTSNSCIPSGCLCKEFVALHKAGTEKPPVKRGPVAGSLCLSVPTSNRKPGHYKYPGVNSDCRSCS